MFLIAVLLLAAGLRAVVAIKGGQFFFPDEARYNEARSAVELLAEGKWRDGIALPFEGGDHAGFKLLSMAPALLERVVGRSGLVPALFFAACSWSVVLLLGLIARRLSGSLAEQLAVTVAAAMSATLLYYARHLLPYDAALALVLLALYLALRAEGAMEKWLLLAAGFAAGCGALVYYGYWISGGLVLVLGVAFPARSVWAIVRRATLAGVGLVAPFALALAINRAWGSGQLIARAQQFSRTITSGGDYRGAVAPLEFLWHAEWGWFVAAVAALAWIAFAWVRRSSRALLSPTARLALVGGAMLWLTFVLTGDVLHKFVVYGRLARQLTPFLALGLGAVTAAAWARGWRAGVVGIGALVAAGAGVLFTETIRLQFPADFAARWQPVLEVKQRAVVDGASYYRFVNVSNYIFEPEVLATAPAETLVAAVHPFSFVPYLYEGFSPTERAQRLAVDHRMRLVRMTVPAAARVTGEERGVVTLRLKFGERRGGFADPLLSVGDPGAGSLFFVRYETDTQIRIGCEIIGAVVYRSEPLVIEPGREYSLQVYCGGLGLPEEASALTRAQVWAALDGRELFNRVLPQATVPPGAVFAGANVVAAGSAGQQFHGEIRSVRRAGSPPERLQAERQGEVGAVRLVVGPPPSRGGRPEPLAVVGEVGQAVLGYLIPLADGRVQVGAEIWGVGVVQSPPLAFRGDGSDEIIYEFACLLPLPGEAAWGRVEMREQAQRRERLRIWLNGQVVVDQAVRVPEQQAITVAIGVNPLGGSFVGGAYSGQVLSSSRLPLDDARLRMR
jgi:hypothetical protein